MLSARSGSKRRKLAVTLFVSTTAGAIKRGVSTSRRLLILGSYANNGDGARFDLQFSIVLAPRTRSGRLLALLNLLA